MYDRTFFQRNIYDRTLWHSICIYGFWRVWWRHCLYHHLSSWGEVSNASSLQAIILPIFIDIKQYIIIITPLPCDWKWLEFSSTCIYSPFQATGCKKLLWQPVDYGAYKSFKVLWCINIKYRVAWRFHFLLESLPIWPPVLFRCCGCSCGAWK
jgi:hypothetical protein